MSCDAEQARREASDWFILLREEPDDAILQGRFEAWKAADPANTAAWNSIHLTFAVMGAGKPACSNGWARKPAGNLRTSRAPVRTGRFARRARVWTPGRIAGSVGIAAAASVAVLAIVPMLDLYLQADYVSGKGTTRTVSLRDGSVMTLGPASAVKTIDTASERGVRLLSGEAWFEVKHDAERPFRVQAESVTVTDVGTKFDVRADDGVVAVSVGEGEVQVFDAARPTTDIRSLRAGGWLDIATDHAVTAGATDPAFVAPWRDGELQARGMTVTEAINEIRPWYSGRIILTDVGFGRQQVTGVYDLQKPQAALEAIVAAHGGVVRHLTPWLLIVSAS